MLITNANNDVIYNNVSPNSNPHLHDNQTHKIRKRNLLNKNAKTLSNVVKLSNINSNNELNNLSSSSMYFSPTKRVETLVDKVQVKRDCKKKQKKVRQSKALERGITIKSQEMQAYLKENEPGRISIKTIQFATKYEIT